MAAAAGIRLSFNATACRNTGTYGSPTWTAIGIVGDVKADMTFEEADSSVRNGAGFKWSDPTLLGISIDLDIKCVPVDTGYLALRAAALARTAVDVMFSTKGNADSGELTLRADFKFFKFGQDEALNGIIVNPCTIKPCYSSNAVTFATNA